MKPRFFQMRNAECERSSPTLPGLPSHGPTVQPSNRPTARVSARQKPARSAGFTLVELLMVMVVGSILIAIISGAYMQARQNAKRARAETQLRELVKAWTESGWPTNSGPPRPA